MGTLFLSPLLACGAGRTVDIRVETAASRLVRLSPRRPGFLYFVSAAFSWLFGRTQLTKGGLFSLISDFIARVELAS